MDALALFTSLDGRLGRRAFWLALLVVYLAGLVAQVLLMPEVLARSGVWPFCAVQAALIWAWLVIHIKRLRDAGQGPATAIAVATIYALAVVLLMVLIAFLTNPNAVATPGEAAQTAGDSWLGFFLVFAIFGVLFSHDFGMFMVILKLMILLACLPALISVVFSLITGARKSADARAAP